MLIHYQWRLPGTLSLKVRFIFHSKPMSLNAMTSSYIQFYQWFMSIIILEVMSYFIYIAHN